jgi:signal transduction histidine kinase
MQHHLRPHKLIFTSTSMRYPLLPVVLWLYALTARAEGVPLTDVETVRRLSPAEAQRGLPVRIVGRLISSRPFGDGSGVIHDGHEAVWCRLGASKPDVWQVVEAEGYTEAGAFAPVLRIEKWRPVNLAVPEPVPRNVDATALQSGALDCQWAEIAGVLMSILPPEIANCTMLRIKTDAGEVDLQTLHSSLPPGLHVDTTIRATGLLQARFDEDRRFMGMFFRVSPPGRIEVTERAPSEAEIPETRLQELLSFSPTPASLHRCRVKGKVTAAAPGERFGISDGSQALIVTGKGEPVEEGDEVEVLGFPTLRDSMPELRYTAWKVAQHGPAPPAERIEANRLSRVNGNLVEVTGTVLSASSDLRQARLRVEGLKQDCEVQWLDPVKGTPYKLETGSKVRVTGLGQLESHVGVHYPYRGVSAINLYPRGSEDIQVVASAPLSSRSLLLLFSSMLGAVMLAALATVMIRQRRMEQEKLVFKEKLLAVSQERHRIAHDLHDTLAQGLTAVSVRLQAATCQLHANPLRAEQHLSAAIDQVSGSLSAARDAIEALRPSILRDKSLAQAVEQVASCLWPEGEVQFQIETTDLPDRMPAFIEHTALFILQEALTNAAKHSGARRVWVRLRCVARSLNLRVSDDGPSSTAVTQQPGHHGLAAMQSRAGECGGTLQVDKNHPQGITISASLPFAY